MVHVDGSLTTCCLDEHLENRLGSLREESLSELWHGPTIQQWRAAHVEGRFAESGPLCTRCNWQSAGAYPPEKVEEWKRSLGDEPSG
jgi:hypothetical protein